MAQDYNINYEDERFQQVEADKNAAMSELEQTYGGMIGEADKYYQAQIDASKQWADKQSQLQQEKTDFTIEQIEQQKQQAHKDYTKEQSGAYVDWQKQSNQYGTEAERMASAGMMGTGFSESSQVGMYNAYQNRVATARESYSQAVLNYNNAIKDARLQNNSVLAEIAYQALQSQLELSLQGFQYKNNLILEQANKKVEMDNQYYNRYMDVLNQINHENAMAEEIRQFEENKKWQTEQAELDRQFQAQQAEITRKFQAAEAELDRKHDLAMQEAKTKAEKELLDKQHELAMKELEQKKKDEIAILERQYELANSNKGGGGSSGISGKGSGGSSGSSVSTSVKGSSGSNATVDTKSVINLGKGPISGSNLAGLVSSGQVTATQQGNKIYVSNSPNAGLAAGQAALDKYTWRNPTSSLPTIYPGGGRKTK